MASMTKCVLALVVLVAALAAVASAQSTVAGTFAGWGSNDHGGFPLCMSSDYTTYKNEFQRWAFKCYGPNNYAGFHDGDIRLNHWKTKCMSYTGWKNLSCSADVAPLSANDQMLNLNNVYCYTNQDKRGYVVDHEGNMKDLSEAVSEDNQIVARLMKKELAPRANSTNSTSSSNSTSTGTPWNSGWDNYWNWRRATPTDNSAYGNVAGWVRPVTFQDTCGHCWSHSAAAAIEFLWWQQLRPSWGSSVILKDSVSKQQISECTATYGNNCGCGGLGWGPNVWSYFTDRSQTYNPSNIVQTEWYYVTRNGMDQMGCVDYRYYQTTQTDQNKLMMGPYASITGYQLAQLSGDENALVAMLRVRVVMISYLAQSSFKNWIGRSDIFIDTTCSGTSTNHGMAATGYGGGSATDGSAFFIVKNSWGTNWGEAGWGKLVRSQTGYLNNCNVATVVTWPTGPNAP